MVANTNESCSDTHAMKPRAGIIRQRQARYRNVTDIDGRTRSGRRARELARQFEAAIGADLTDNQRLAIGRAATLTAIAEDRRMRALAGEPVLLDDLVRVERLVPPSGSCDSAVREGMKVVAFRQQNRSRIGAPWHDESEAERGSRDALAGRRSGDCFACAP